MKKFLIILGVVLVLIFGLLTYFRMQTKSYSPEEVVKYENDDLKISVVYNRPFKKDRNIFGELVPYGKVWRTGANEATIFETNKDLAFGDKVLKAGKYTLWTIPNEQTWTIIFNSETGQWGVGFNGEANRDPQKDVLAVDAVVVLGEKEIEQFTIALAKSAEENELTLFWDKTWVTVPFSAK